MTNAIRDENHNPVVLGQSSTDSNVTLPFKIDSVTGRLLTDTASGSGTVTSVSVVSANGFAGTVATATTTPAITLTTTNTTGSVLFASSNALGQDNSNFFWDNTNKRLGIGTNAPGYKLDVFGDAKVGNASAGALIVSVTTGTGDSYIDIGTNGTGSRYSYLDFVGDTTYTDFGLRLIRGNGGANAYSQLVHRGTGTLSLYTVEAAPIQFYTNSSVSARMTIASGGNVGIGTTAPGATLHLIATTPDIWMTEDGVRTWAIRSGGSASGTFDIADITGGASRFSINSSGYVGIGGISAAVPLQVQGVTPLRLSRSGNNSFDASVSGVMTGTTAGDLIWDTVQADGGFAWRVQTGTVIAIGITDAANVGIGTTNPTAYLHIKAGTASANTAPLKLTSGTNLTTPEAGAIEFDGTYLYITT